MSPRSTYLFLATAQGFLFWTVVALNLLYHHVVVGLNPLQMVLVGTVLEASVFLFEVPTGVVADMHSRRLSVVIGFALMGFGFVVEGCFPTFMMLLAAQVIWGCGATFISGASDAWLADELAFEGVPEDLPAVLLRANQWRQLGSLAGIGVSLALATWFSLATPIVVGGAGMMLLAPILFLIMKEDGFRPLPKGQRNNWASVRHTFTEGMNVLQTRPVLWSILAISLFFGMFSETFDRLWVVHLRQNFVIPSPAGMNQLVWFGLVPAVTMLLTMGLTQLVKRKNLSHGPALVRSLYLFNFSLAVGVVLFALVGNFYVALLLYWIISAIRSSLMPLYSAWINSHVSSEVRATLLSVNSQADALGQVVGGPGLGAIGWRLSVRLALALAGLFLVPALALYHRLKAEGLDR